MNPKGEPFGDVATIGDEFTIMLSEKVRPFICGFPFRVPRRPFTVRNRRFLEFCNLVV